MQVNSSRYRPYQHFFLLLSLLLVAVCGLAGCLKTPIAGLEIDEAVHALALSSDDPLPVSIKTNDAHSTIGHQYLFVLFPFGRVSIADIEQYLFEAAFVELALSGKKPILADSEQAPFSHLEISLKELQATAYDLLAVRWIKTRIVIEVRYRNSRGQEYRREFSDTSSAFKQFAFSKQLSFYLNNSTRDLFKEMAAFIGQHSNAGR